MEEPGSVGFRVEDSQACNPITMKERRSADTFSKPNPLSHSFLQKLRSKSAAKGQAWAGWKENWGLRTPRRWRGCLAGAGSHPPERGGVDLRPHEDYK